MPDMLIRDLDEHIHVELKRRADDAGMSLQRYVSRMLAQHVSQPTIEEWLAELDDLDPIEGVSGTDAVAAARAELP